MRKGFINTIKPDGKIEKQDPMEQPLEQLYKPKQTPVTGTTLYQTRPLLHDYINKILNFHNITNPEDDTWYMMTVWVRRTKEGYIELGV